MVDVVIIVVVIVVVAIVVADVVAAVGALESTGALASFHVSIPVSYKVFIKPDAFHWSLDVGKLEIGLYIWGVHILKKKENKIRIREKTQLEKNKKKKTMRIVIVRTFCLLFKTLTLSNPLFLSFRKMTSP